MPTRPSSTQSPQFPDRAMAGSQSLQEGIGSAGPAGQASGQAGGRTLPKPPFSRPPLQPFPLPRTGDAETRRAPPRTPGRAGSPQGPARGHLRRPCSPPSEPLPSGEHPLLDRVHLSHPALLTLKNHQSPQQDLGRQLHGACPPACPGRFVSRKTADPLPLRSPAGRDITGPWAGSHRRTAHSLGLPMPGRRGCSSPGPCGGGVGQGLSPWLAGPQQMTLRVQTLPGESPQRVWTPHL